jgi:hypothetical protein
MLRSRRVILSLSALRVSSPFSAVEFFLAAWRFNPHPGAALGF